jgi:putative ABC transport system permease protein
MPMPFQSVVVRAKRDRSVSIGDVRAVMRQLDAGVALANLMPLEQWVRMHTRERQFALLILAAFGGLAVALGAIGVYGAASYAVSRRQRDIGIRVALGATPREIIAMVLAHGMTLAATGVAAGIVLGFGLGRFVRAMLYDVSAADPLTFSGVPLALLVVAALACYLPARRATRIDPLVALRAE